LRLTMATSIEKLGIRGIRSYSPYHEQETIEFFKPLTLIVGKNGCGKTTIIECLKMMCSGELPPNCKTGQAFINDPNVFGVTEVKASINLKLIAKGQPIVCTRSFSLVQKGQPPKKEYKAVEAALKHKDSASGEITCSSYKPTELNKKIPEMMGVSSAILESVVFVHQEESCWPLSDDATLKKKFDDIFAATDYTKALEEINKFKKEKKTEEKVLKAELGVEEEKLSKANEMRQELTELQKNVLDLKARMEEQQQKIESANLRCDRLKRTKSQRDQLRSRVNTLHLEHQQLTNAVAQSVDRLAQLHNEGEFEESTEEIRQLQTEQNGISTKLQTDIEAAERKAKDLEASIERADKRKEEALNTLSGYRAAAEQQRALEKECGGLIEILRGQYALPLSCDGNATMSARGREAVKLLQRQLDERERALNDSNGQHRSKLQSKMASLQQTLSQLKNCDAEVAAKEDEAKQLKREEAQLVDQLNDLPQADESKRSRLQSELNTVKAELKLLLDEQKESHAAEELGKGQRKIKQLKDSQVNLVEELQRLDRERDKLMMLQEVKRVYEERRDRLANAIRDETRLKRVLGPAVDLQALLERGSLEREINKVKESRAQERERKERETSGALDKLLKKKNELLVKQSELQQLEDQKNGLEANLRAQDPRMLGEDYDFQSEMTQLEEKIGEETSNHQMSKTMAEFFDRAAAAAETGKNCLVCNQQCNDDAKQHIRALQSKVKRKQEQGADAAHEEKVRELNATLGKRRLAAQDAATYKRLRAAGVPQLAACVDELRAESIRLQGEHARLEDELKEAREQENEVLRLEVHSLKAMHAEASEAKEKYERSLVQSSAVSQLRQKEEVTLEWEQVQEEIRALEKTVESLDIKVRQKEEAVQSLMSSQSSLELKLARVEHEIEKRTRVEEQLRSVQAKSARLLLDAKRQRESKGPLELQAKREETEMQEMQAEADSASRELESRVTQARRDYDKLQHMVERIESYTAESLKDAEAQYDRDTSAIAAKKQQLKGLSLERDKMRAMLHSKNELKMLINANLELREHREGAEEKRNELQAAQKELLQLAGADGVDEALEKAENEINQGKRDYAHMEGALQPITLKATALQRQLKEPKYKHIDAEHRKKLIEYKTVQMCALDLERYYHALDRALMKFHSTKMQDINKQIKELWNKTYKGTDIDNIEIHSEHEGESKSGARKHTYRVQMYKQGAALDMRGRCSAGQKVLACLIIRLALAETFCLNCGILALDEPTTNLDKPNVEAFAGALNDIIKTRKQQSNFQLVVITHDEDFVQLIGRSENCSHYYRVSKEFHAPNEPPVSTIKQHPIDSFG